MVMKKPEKGLIERRDVTLPVELRDSEPGKGPGKLVGYAARYGVESYPICEWAGGSFIEVIQRGAFTRTLKENSDIRALYNHDSNIVLGRTKSGTLRLSEDSTGLAFDVDLPDTQAARDVREMVKRGDISGCSFGFVVLEDRFEDRDGVIVRTLLDIDLIEVSPAVCFPAYGDTSVAVRSRKGQPVPRPRLASIRRKLRIIDLN